MFVKMIVPVNRRIKGGPIPVKGTILDADLLVDRAGFLCTFLFELTICDVGLQVYFI